MTERRIHVSVFEPLTPEQLAEFDEENRNVFADITIVFDCWDHGQQTYVLVMEGTWAGWFFCPVKDCGGRVSQRFIRERKAKLSPELARPKSATARALAAEPERPFEPPRKSRFSDPDLAEGSDRE